MKKIVLKIALDIKEICIPLYKILIPFVFIVKLLEISGVIEFLAKLIEPFMSLVGLTPELGLVLVFRSIYYSRLYFLFSLFNGNSIGDAQDNWR